MFDEMLKGLGVDGNKVKQIEALQEKNAKTLEAILHELVKLNQKIDLMLKEE